MQCINESKQASWPFGPIAKGSSTLACAHFAVARAHTHIGSSLGSAAEAHEGVGKALNHVAEAHEGVGKALNHVGNALMWSSAIAGVAYAATNIFGRR